MNTPELNPTTFDNQEQLIRRLVQAFLSPAQKGECKCHWIDAKRIPILAWKSTDNTLVLKISTQQFIGLTRVDKNGVEYWKFREFYEEPSPIPEKKEPVVEPTESKEVATFKENEVSVKQKYGTGDSPKVQSN